MTTVICGYKNCSYNVENLCGKNFIGINTKRYGPQLCVCNGFTTEKVDDIVKEIYPIEAEIITEKENNP